MLENSQILKGHITEKVKLILWIVMVALVLVVVLFPVYLLIKYSLHSNVVTYGRPLPLFPNDPTLGNFINLLMREQGLKRALWNSFYIAISTVLFTLFMGLPAGYVLARFNFPFKRLFLILIVSLRLFPDISSVIPVTTFFIKLEMQGTYSAIILAHTLLALPYVIYIASFAFEFVPRDVEEQARVLGAGRFRIFFWVLIPMILPSVITSAIYTFLLSWDEFIFAHFLLGNSPLQTLTLYLDSVAGGNVMQENVQSAISVILSVPVIIFTYIVQRYMVSGATMGSIK